MGNGTADKDMTFWEHLDELRGVLFRGAVVLFSLMIVVFFFKRPLFDIILAPLTSDFITYRVLNSLLVSIGLDPVDGFAIEMVNVEMTAQFFTHVKVSLLVALVISLPVLAYFLWTFVRPALYRDERNAVRRSFGFSAVLFYIGILVGYLLVFPLTVRFLGTYQVSEDVPNRINLTSYIGMFMSLLLIMGIVFEMPALARLLSHFGIINRQLLKKYRKHAFVVLVILAAVITPSGDAVTLFFVAIPLYFLYQVSIWVTKPATEEEEDSAGNVPEGGKIDLDK